MSEEVKSIPVDNLYCKTCNRTMDKSQFYQTRRLDKYSTGYLPECKKCLTRHVDNWDPETFKWILEEIDLPYIPHVWNTLLQKAVDSNKKITGMTILGKYISSMKLNQHKNKRWADTERILEEEAMLQTQAMKESGDFSEEDIAESIENSKKVTVEKPKDLVATEAIDTENTEAIDLNAAEYFNDDLTEEDKKYLTIKWGKAYKPYEWVQLEKYYQEMMSAFDIVTPSHEDSLRLICKTSLKMHQCIDIGDIEGFQKLSRVYTQLMKDSKFTAAQNKGESGDYVSSISEFVLLCEREGYIERYYQEDEVRDKADETLKDLRSYIKRLVVEELNLGNIIEASVRKMEAEENKAEDDETIEFSEDDLETFEKEVLNDNDFLDYYQQLSDEQDDDFDDLESAGNALEQIPDGIS